MKVIEFKDPPPVEVIIERFGQRRLPFVLDSAQANDGLGQWSFFGADPFAVVSGSLADLRRAMADFDSSGSPDIPFTGGAVGYLSYDYGRRLEKLPSTARDDRGIPDMHFGIYDGVAALDHGSGNLYLVAHGLRGDEDAVIEELKGILEAETKADMNPVFSHEPWQWNLTKEDFCTAVQSVRAYIASGDVYQVNLSQRARCAFEGNGLSLYQALRRGNPAPYGAYLDLGSWQFISTSPSNSCRSRVMLWRLARSRAHGRVGRRPRRIVCTRRRSVPPKRIGPSCS